MVAERALRVVFLGTPDFALPTLDALLRSRHRVVGVVTQPDRPRGRGHQTEAPPVKTAAVRAGVPVLQPGRLSEPAFLGALAELAPDLGVVAAYGKILTDAVLATPRLGLLNVHASLLPRHRGAAPVHRAVIDGESETGVTIMRVVKALDQGPMLASARCPIDSDQTSEELDRQLATLGAALVISTIDALAAGRAHETPQDESKATYAPRLTKEDGLIDWSRSARQIHDRIRGLHPWPLAFSFLRGRRLILRRSAVAESGPDASGRADARPAPGSVMKVRLNASRPPGSVVEAAGDRLVVAAGSGAVALLEIQSEGKRPTTAREFLAGHPLEAGERFTPRP